MKILYSTLSREQVKALLQCYDTPHPIHAHRILRGYDKSHALRTARMCVPVAFDLGHPPTRVQHFEIACLLHDIGRAGLVPKLFGQIWSWAKQQGIPTRPREWRARYPDTPYGKESQAFLKHYGPALQQAQGLQLTPLVREHVDMRLGFARRLRKQMTRIQSHLQSLGLPWSSWMGKIMLYYYYPEKLQGAALWIHQLGEILVACEKLEAFSNHRRGQDYYVRSRETFKAAFSYLQELTTSQLLSQPVFDSICRLTQAGCFTATLRQARGGKLSPSEERFLHHLPINQLETSSGYVRRSRSDVSSPRHSRYTTSTREKN